MTTISPPSRISFTAPSAPFGPHPRSTQMAQDPQSEAQQAERAAQIRIADAQRQVESTQSELNTSLDHMKDQYEQRSVAEAVNEDEALEKQRSQGYQALRDLKRNQQKEITRLQTEGELEKSRLEGYFRNSVNNTEHQGKQRLNDTQNLQAREVEIARKAAAHEVEETRAQNSESLQRLREDSDEKFAAIAAESQESYDKTRGAANQASEQAAQHFQERFQTERQSQDEIINRMHNSASGKIREIRQDTSQKLSAYNARQKDPFYKMLDFDMRMQDTGKHYVLTADIPEYEQKHVSVALKGNNLVISGYRRNEEKLDLAPGHTKGTAAYQSFHESFPLAFPVDGKHLLREFSGNKLTVTVPKKEEYTIYKAPDAKPERVHVEKPKFPTNLPPADGDVGTGLDGGPVADGSDGASHRPIKTKGSGTLG